LRDYYDIRRIPKEPGIYCLLGHSERGAYPAYVGKASRLQIRVSQHLEYKNSSVTTRASAASLSPELIAGCQYWTHADFADAAKLAAAELVAFDLLQPVLRSLGGLSQTADALRRSQGFEEWARRLLGQPSGEVRFRSISELSAVVRALEERVVALESKLAEQYLAVVARISGIAPP
jgi:hypothetical protein